MNPQLPALSVVHPRLRWNEFVGRVVAPDDRRMAVNVYEILDKLYGGEDRHYHNWAHIGWCLDILTAEFFEVEPLPEWFTRVELALWFHDCVYEPKRKDNEERSAHVLVGAASLLGLDPKLAADAAFDVGLTTHHYIPSKANSHAVPTQWVLDLDLASLGFSSARFDENSAQIREEYAFVPEDAFKAGRKAALQGFFDRPRIYLTEECHKRFEGQARDNLQRSIAALG
jgi:predicted metal-dependent HD superfamily phosphohydrolase